MYDLEALRYLNQQAHIRAVALANEDRNPDSPISGETRVIKPPPVFPLSIIAGKLQGGPPSLAYFVELIQQSEWFKDFLDLVREYLPEHEVDILAEDLDRRAFKFVNYFSQKYFPLRDDVFDERVSIADLIDSVPVQLMGFSYESYHGFMDFRQGYILLLSLITCPWEEDPYGDDIDEGEGARVPILQEVINIVGVGLVNLIQPNGWSPEELHELTDDTEFDGCGEFADWVYCGTGNVLLDTHGEYSEMGQQIPWGREAVDDITNEWHYTCEFFDKVNRLALLLEQDPEGGFRRLLSLLLVNPDMIIPKEQLHLPLD